MSRERRAALSGVRSAAEPEPSGTPAGTCWTPCGSGSPRAGPSRRPRAWRRRCGRRGGCSGTPKCSAWPSALRSELVGTGPLEPLLADPAVTDVLVTAPDRVWVDRGGGLERPRVASRTRRPCAGSRSGWPRSAGRRLDDARPWVDARLPDGTRLHAVLPPVAVGSHLPVAAGGAAAGVHAWTSWWPRARCRRAGTGCCGPCWTPGCPS